MKRLFFLAMLLMLLDHMWATVWDVPWFTMVGRLAFPIFAFQIAEGFYQTSNRKNYIKRMLLFALISEIPWNFMGMDSWRYMKQNVYFTLFFGYLAICLIEYYRGNAWMQFVCVFALLWTAKEFNADYGWKGYIFILIMYMLRTSAALQAIIGSCWLHYEWKACFAFIPINMYNGKRGFIKGKFAKYFFYVFYPLHITILVILRRILF
jgi:hypothetical protein